MAKLAKKLEKAVLAALYSARGPPRVAINGKGGRRRRIFALKKYRFLIEKTYRQFVLSK